MLTRGIVAIPRFRLPSLVRRMHVDNGPGESLPFSLKNTKTIGTKMFVFLSIPFTIPIIGVLYQIRKKTT